MSEEISCLTQLDPELLYLFVVGPGRGEALAIALPGKGWLVVDGCRSDRRSGGALPVERILERWRREPSDPVWAMILSHPHADHVEGFVELLEKFGPRYVVVAGASTLVNRAQRLDDERTSAKSWTEGVASKKARDALAAIRLWAKDHPEGLVDAVDGARIPVGEESLGIHVRAPDKACVGEIMGSNFAHERANEASIVVEILFGEAGIVLGGDLPWKRNAVVCSRGWDGVMGRHPQLAQHQVLKVPHHGSSDALHPDLLREAEMSRFWCVTPYNSSDIPDSQPGGGLEVMLSRESSVHLTALAAPLTLQCAWPPPARVSISHIEARSRGTQKGHPLFDKADDLRPERAIEPLDPLWCCAIDRRGKIVGRWRGRAAMEVVMDGSPHGAKGLSID